MLCNVVLTFESVDEILNCDQSNENYCMSSVCNMIYYAVQAGSNISDLCTEIR